MYGLGKVTPEQLNTLSPWLLDIMKSAADQEGAMKQASESGQLSPQALNDLKILGQLGGEAAQALYLDELKSRNLKPTSDVSGGGITVSWWMVAGAGAAGLLGGWLIFKR